MSYALVKVSLLRNLKICDGLQMLDAENRVLLRRGNAPVVRRGPYTGQKAEVDHIVPLAQAREAGNELANLEMLPCFTQPGKIGPCGLAAACHGQEIPGRWDHFGGDASQRGGEVCAIGHQSVGTDR